MKYMGMLKDQQYINKQFPMPVDDISTSSSVNTISAETVQLYYNNAGTRTSDAGQAAGTAVTGQLANKNILDVGGGYIGTKGDTSLSFTSTALTTEVQFPNFAAEKAKDAVWNTKLADITASFANGEYCVDYRSGTIYGVKTSTTTTLASTSYQINVAQTITGGGLSSDVNIANLAGTAVNLDDAAFAVGVDAVLPTGFLADETATDSVDEGDTGIGRMTLDRKQIVSIQTISGIGHGVKTVTTAGTDEALSGVSAICKRVIVQSQTDNTGLIAVGATGVDATEATGNGVILYAGDSIDFEIDDLADVFVDSSIDGEGVRFTYFT